MDCHAFLEKGIIKTQLLHRLTYTTVRYYKLGRKGLGYLKNKVLRHSVKRTKKPVLESNSINKTPAMSSTYFH
jgi:hypothetical protein